MSATRKRILLFGYLPPPVFGPSVAYQALLHSGFTREYDVTVINISVVKSIRELESVSIGKLAKLGVFFLRELFYLTTRRFDYCCYPISFNRNAFLKDWVLLRLARCFGVPVVLFAHGTGLAKFQGSLSPRLRRMFDDTVSQSAGVIVIAQALRADFEALLPADKIFVVTLGIEPSALPVPSRKPAGPVTVLYLGALVRAKGIFDLLEAIPAIHTRLPTAKLVVAGEWFRPDDAAAAQQLIREHHLEGVVEFVGPVTGEAKWRWLQSADLLVFPPHSQTEAFGIVLLEALQAGLPIVATRGGARSEIVADGRNGLLAEERNPQDLAEKILALAGDAELRARMAETNRAAFAARYTHDEYGRRMSEVFTALEKRGTSRA